MTAEKTWLERYFDERMRTPGEDSSCTAESFVKWYKTWNIRDEDTAKFMDGIYKTGVLDGETKGSANRP